MISTKIATIIAVAAFAAGGFVMSPMPQAIAAVIATDVQCTGCVGIVDLAGNAVTAAKVKDGEIKAAEIATDAVGAAEIQGVTKLLFGRCVPTESQRTDPISPGFLWQVVCNINGVDGDDSASATLNNPASSCFEIAHARTGSNFVAVEIRNDCGSVSTLGSASSIAVIVFDK